jgi:hypothetical protein
MSFLIIGPIQKKQIKKISYQLSEYFWKLIADVWDQLIS